MKKFDVIKLILAERIHYRPRENFIAEAFAPSNIALCKYWGKRNIELNLPVTSSLSISLKNLGSTIKLSINPEQDQILLNDKSVDFQTEFASRFVSFINLFRAQNDWYFTAEIESTIPIGAGLASSACGFASLVKALDQLFDWQLDLRSLSILARLGSGSASRSLWDGFVEWHAGEREDGMDSYAEALPYEWPELCVELLILNSNKKIISSRDAMNRTVETSSLYKDWPQKVADDLPLIRQAIQEKNFELLGRAAESNAIAMHATMFAASPSISYSLPETNEAMHKIWQLRAEGLPVFFTQDAGPNLKLLFLKSDVDAVKKIFW